MIRFKPYEGDLIGLPTSDNHLNFRWIEPKCKVLFSVCQQGNGASIHFASDKKGLRKLKQAINEFCDFCFYLFDWCEMIIGKIQIPSVERLVVKCGFGFLGNFDNNIRVWVKEKK